MKKLIIITILLIPALTFSQQLTVQDQLNNLADNVVEIALGNMSQKLKTQKEFDAVTKLLKLQSDINLKNDFKHRDIYKQLKELREQNRLLEQQIDLIE